jgi:tetratricopeptide (TPR) repeat protein
MTITMTSINIKYYLGIALCLSVLLVMPGCGGDKAKRPDRLLKSTAISTKSELQKKTQKRHSSGRAALDYEGEAIAPPIDSETAPLTIDGIPLSELGKDMRRAVRHFNNGLGLMETNPKRAMESFKTALSIIPDFAEAHHNIGLILYRLGKRKLARDSFFKAIRGGKQVAEAYNALGNIYQREGKINEAARAYRNAAAIEPRASIYINLGNLYRIGGNSDQAVANYMRAEKLDPINPYIDFNYGAVLLDIGRIKEAKKRLNRSQALKKRHPQVIAVYAKALLLDGEVETALGIYRAFSIMNPELAYPHRDLGIIYEIYKRDYDMALKHYKIFVSLEDRQRRNSTSLKEVRSWIEVVRDKKRRGDNQ